MIYSSTKSALWGCLRAKICKDINFSAIFPNQKVTKDFDVLINSIDSIEMPDDFESSLMSSSTKPVGESVTDILNNMGKNL